MNLTSHHSARISGNGNLIEEARCSAMGGYLYLGYAYAYAWEDIYRGGSCCVAGDARWILRFVDWVVFGFRETLRELRCVGRRGEESS
jgi:hypothetical protein